MSQTAARMLSLLSLLQGPRDWTGTELAERLQVSGRTVRSDIERLRDLGYAVHATRGGTGGYRLGASGASLPPLLLDAEEAVAMAVGLRTGVNCIIGGMEETSVQALTKLEQILPTRLRQQVRTLNRYTVPLPSNQPVPIVDPAVLTTLAGLCRTQERIRFDYSTSSDEAPASTPRDVEPYRLVNRGHRWYLLGFDIGDDGWQIYEIQRIRLRVPTGPRFSERELPATDVAGYVSRRVPGTAWRHRATATIYAPADQVREWIAPAEGFVAEALDNRSCKVVVGGQSLATIALVLVRLGADFMIADPPELREEVLAMADRCARAANTSDQAIGKSRARQRARL